MACFPMIPYASLIHDATFTWSGNTYRVKPNMPDRPHALHGDAWQHEWEVDETGPGRVVLRYRQEGDRFPFPYEATLTASVRFAELSLTLLLFNRGTQPMPAGMGFHPFFPRRPDLTLEFDATQKWTRDLQGRMLQPHRCGEDESWSSPRSVTHLACNDVYDGWSRSAVLDLASPGLRVALTAEGVLDRLLLFSPTDRDVVCVEPISNLPDGFNLLAAGSTDSGVRVLAPGECIAGTMRIAAARAK
jgi:aldose 1-epimerase